MSRGLFSETFTSGNDGLYGDAIWVNLSAELIAVLTNLVVRNWVNCLVAMATLT